MSMIKLAEHAERLFRDEQACSSTGRPVPPNLAGTATGEAIHASRADSEREARNPVPPAPAAAAEGNAEGATGTRSSGSPRGRSQASSCSRSRTLLPPRSRRLTSDWSMPTAAATRLCVTPVRRRYSDTTVPASQAASALLTWALAHRSAAGGKCGLREHGPHRSVPLYLLRAPPHATHRRPALSCTGLPSRHH
ncbi:MAG TPA: hypothetical protein VE733_25455 [Streptosporangiaceae bacterium]|nr:hypothetical protein [Streptosporangiaceae bacterium]